jgi:hypothetical protein
VLLDVLLGLAALALAGGLGAAHPVLADHLAEGDERWRERHAWAHAFEPSHWTAQDRLVVIRAWLALCATAFLIVGLGLVGRGLIG